MDEVIEQFQTTLGQPSNTEDAGDQKTTFDGLYKNWGRLGQQEERRMELLEVQKSNRNQKLDKFRGILELVNAVEEQINWNNESSYKVHYRPSIYVAGFNKASHTYRDVLMLSEWMIEKPSDFHENWYVVPCPKGVRMLVVANGGSTKCYTKYGQFRFERSTALPGGHRSNNPKERRQCCVLDCFYIEKTNTMYVLDLLAWNSTPMTDGETEFRHFWLISKFAELPSMLNITRVNKMIFKILPKVPCDPDSINSYLKNYPLFEGHYPTLDGLLFYHRRAHYVSGETPLVGWLYPYMLPEVLGPDITINRCFMEGKPLEYVNQADYIQKFEEKYAKKNTPRSRRMSTSSSPNETPVPNTIINTKPIKGKSSAKLAAKTSNKTKSTTAETMESENVNDKVTNTETNAMDSDENKEQDKMDDTRQETEP